MIVSVREIAKRLDVDFTTVNKWRRRYSDFPDEVSRGYDNRSLFNWNEVQEWAEQTGRWDHVGLPIRKRKRRTSTSGLGVANVNMLTPDRGETETGTISSAPPAKAAS